MELGYQRGKIQEESVLYEMQKHTGELPIIGVNTFIDPQASEEEAFSGLELARSSETEKKSQLGRVQKFQEKHKERAPEAIRKLQEAALSGQNIFAEMMNTVRYCSLGQITSALYEVGGQYRRNM